MSKIKKYLKSITIYLSLILIFLFLINIINYYEILNQNIYKIVLIIINSISVFISAYILGINSKEKGYLEGLKLGGIIITILLIISKIIYKNPINKTTLLYYLIIIIITTIASVLGINKNKE